MKKNYKNLSIVFEFFKFIITLSELKEKIIK